MADGGGSGGASASGGSATVYVDGSGGDDPGFGYYVAETGESFYEKRKGITRVVCNLRLICRDARYYRLTLRRAYSGPSWRCDWASLPVQA